MSTVLRPARKRAGYPTKPACAGELGRTGGLLARSLLVYGPGQCQESDVAHAPYEAMMCYHECEPQTTPPFIS